MSLGILIQCTLRPSIAGFRLDPLEGLRLHQNPSCSLLHTGVIVTALRLATLLPIACRLRRRLGRRSVGLSVG